jgi:hypothetical protein
MKRVNILTIDRMILFLLCLAYVCAVILPHILQTTTLEEYNGMQKWDLGLYGYCFLAIGTTASVPILFTRRFVPSDFFVVLYFLVVIIPFIVLYSVSGYVSNEILIPSLVILLLPLVIMLLIRNLSFRFSKMSLLSDKTITYLLLLMATACVIFAYLIAPSSSGFGIDSSYNRRIDGRDIVGEYPLFAYLISMCVNMFIPFFAFMGGFTKRKILLAVSIALALFFFWLLGVKATFLYLVVAYTVGWLLLNGRLHRLPYYILSAMVFLFVIFLVEYWASGYSFVADYFSRRLFSVGVQLQGYYLDLIINNPPLHWNFFTGSDNPSFAVTFYVGDYYVGNPLTNASTNAFLYAFGQKGLFGYMLAVIVVPSVFLLFDRIYRTHQNPICMVAGFTFATLILEQAYTTALLSSGVGFIFVLAFLEKANNKGSRINKVPRGEAHFAQ